MTFIKADASSESGIQSPHSLKMCSIANLAVSTVILILASTCSAQICATETNNARAQNGGLPALRYNAQLAAAAAAHNNVMISRNCFSHQCPNEADLGTRVTAAGFRWSTLGENLAAGHTSCQAAVAGWLTSPGHRANLLQRAFTQFGCAQGNTNNAYRQYWTCVYGA